MFEIPGVTSEATAGPRMIDFGRGGKVLFQLPVIGDKGVPVGVTTAITMFQSKWERKGQTLSNSEVANAWAYFIDTLAANYPDATRHLSMLDEDGLAAALEHWFVTSKEIAGADPKA